MGPDIARAFGPGTLDADAYQGRNRRPTIIRLDTIGFQSNFVPTAVTLLLISVAVVRLDRASSTNLYEEESRKWRPEYSH